MKFESLRTARRYWISGIIIALVGIALARVVASHLDPKAAAIAKVVGQLLALGGLLIIALGIKRRTTEAGDTTRKSE